MSKDSIGGRGEVTDASSAVPDASHSRFRKALRLRIADGREQRTDSLFINAERVGFVLGDAVAPDTVCHVGLPAANDELIWVDGRVTGCHRMGRHHVIEIIFDEAVDLSRLWVGQ